MRISSLLAAALVVSGTAAHADLKIRDIEAAHGQLGPERKSLDVYPLDEVVFRYLVAGVETDDQGRVDGELRMTLEAPDGRTLLDDASPISGVTPLGGGSLPGTARVGLPADVAPGDYELTVTFRDKPSGATASFRRTLRVKGAEFAAVAVRFSYDAAGEVPAPVGGMVGQTLHYRLKAIGFDRAGDRIDLEMAVQVLDAEGRPTMPVPVRAVVGSDRPEVVRRATDVSLSGSLTLNRAGDFTLVIKLTDRVGGKSTEFEAPLHVASP